VSFQCEDARPLIASYVDGELTEARAVPLRQHLLSCGACRVLVQDQKALKRWFAPRAAAEVPAGFAERVARRAFAGDRGVSTVPSNATSDPSRLESYLFRLASFAAAAAIVCALLVRQQALPSSDVMRGDVEAPTLEELRLELEELNADEDDRADATDEVVEER